MTAARRMWDCIAFLALAVISSAAGLLDQLTQATGLTATTLLLAALALLILVLLAFMAIAARLSLDEVDQAEAPGLRHKTTDRCGRYSSR